MTDNKAFVEKNYEEKTETRIDGILNQLNDVEKISYETLSIMRDKKEKYFGAGPKKEAGGSAGPSTGGNGITGEMSISLSAIRKNLTEIIEILNLF